MRLLQTHGVPIHADAISAAGPSHLIYRFPGREGLGSGGRSAERC